MPIRIAHIIDNLDRGGTQTWFRLLTAGLARRNYEQHVFCLNGTFHPGILADIRRNTARVEVIGRPRLFAGIGLAGLQPEFRLARPAPPLPDFPLAKMTEASENLDRQPRQAS